MFCLKVSIKVELCNGFYFSCFTDSGIKFRISKGIIIGFILSTPSVMVFLALWSSCVREPLYHGQAWSWGGREVHMGNYFISGNIILAVYKLFTACRNMIDAALTLTPLGTVFSLSTEIQSQVSLCVRLCWFSCCLWERSSYFILSSPQFQYFTSLRSYSKTLATLPLNL